MLSVLVIILSLIIFATICWKWLDFGLGLVVLGMPFYLLRMNIGPLPSTFLELMILTLCLIFVVKKIINREAKSTFENWRVLLKKWWLPILLFLLAAIISVFVSADFKHALGRWRAYFFEPILIFLIFLDVVRSKKQLQIVIWALGLSSLAISFGAVFQYIFNINIPADYNIPNLKRATSFYDYPNAIGLYVAPIVTLFCGLIIGIKQENKKTRKQFMSIFVLLFFCFVVLLGVVAVIFAVSKGAIFGILVGLFFMLMFTKWRWFVVGLAIFSIIVVLIVPATSKKVIPIITFQETSGDVRLVLWEGTWNLIKANPIFGAGLAGFQKAYPNYKLNKHTEILVYPHNIVLNFWVETGILGLISFAWLIVLFFISGFKDTRCKIQTNSKFQIPNSKQNTKSKLQITKIESFFSVVLMGAMVCIIMHGLVDVPYFKNDLSLLFWIIIGLMIITKIKSQK
ncbi:MAG: O-antigen ligase family protein [Patescibacteria group bacterium]|nr:O-antigen ligase family protein [Patescibacteria group bacterium]